MFTIYAIVANYDDRDAISGYKAVALPYRWLNGEAAEGFAAAIDRKASDEGYDNVYHVVRAPGVSPFARVAPSARQVNVRTAMAMDDIPF
jgi:hypothetical protein